MSTLRSEKKKKKSVGYNQPNPKVGNTNSTHGILSALVTRKVAFY
jgi:hypothetical protein